MSLVSRLIRAVRPAPLWSGFPPEAEIDRARLAEDLGLPAPEIEYVMFFTPRSGSTWLADLMSRTRRMGRVREAFNPNFLPAMTRAVNARSLGEYCDVAARRWQSGGAFGFQITHHQLSAVFGSQEAFLARYPGPHCFWLVREDIVLQAVSLHKMQATRLSHAPQAPRDRISARETSFVYDAGQIRRWLNHIRAAERDTEALFEAGGLAPLRMTYEHNITLKPNHLVNVIGRHMGLETMRMKPLHSPHEKIGTGLNGAYAERFRREESTFVAEIEEERRPMLAKVGYYGPRRPGPEASA